MKKKLKNNVIFYSRKDQCEDPYSGDICNNNGDCECNSCQCHSGFDGKFCQINKDDDQDEETCEILKPCILHDLYGQDKNVDDDFKVWLLKKNLGQYFTYIVGRMGRGV